MAYYESARNYEKKNLLTVRVGFNRKTESDLVERIEREPKGQRATFLKNLVREDIDSERTDMKTRELITRLEAIEDTLADAVTALDAWKEVSEDHPAASVIAAKNELLDLIREIECELEPGE